jgi:transcriptional regulator with GAF, ATPase, and Fis domain
MLSSLLDRVGRTPLAREIEERSASEWSGRRPTVIVGRHQRLTEALEEAVRYGPSESPVLITGETGTGKELFARVVFLYSCCRRRTMLSINCAQYSDGNLLASELFGHRKGSFTGAVADKRGLFEEADGGAVFLDEVGELSPTAQAMLLRVLSEGEVVPVGSSQARQVSVRVIAATSRDLPQMVAAGTFRADLFYRLQYLQVRVPPLRERGGDWQLIAGHYLAQLGRRSGTERFLSVDALLGLKGYAWPGNVREVRGMVDTGFHRSTAQLITLADLGAGLESAARSVQFSSLAVTAADELCARMVCGETNFWEAVHRPFMERDLNRAEVQEVVACGLRLVGGSYKRLLAPFGLGPDEYLRFMDTLRHHRLKPERPQRDGEADLPALHVGTRGSRVA